MGIVTLELSNGVYEVTVEKYGLAKICELMQNDEVIFLNRKSTCGGSKISGKNKKKNRLFCSRYNVQERYDFFKS